MIKSLIFAIVALGLISTTAEARHRHHHHRHNVSAPAPELCFPWNWMGCPQASPEAPGRHRAGRHFPAAGMIQVATAAGIEITVAPGFAPKITGFIRDVVATGYHPQQIHCYAAGGHVRGSWHYRGGACDFDQHRRGRTATAMHHIRALADKWKLRDGCTFHDCGHVDDGG